MALWIETAVILEIETGDMVWFCMVLYGFVWFCMVWYGMVWFGMVLCGLVWFGMAVNNYPKLTLFDALESAHWFLSYEKVVFHCQLMCTDSSPLYWAQKTTPK